MAYTLKKFVLEEPTLAFRFLMDTFDISMGEAQKIVYDAESGLLNLVGNAYLYQNGASIRSNTLKYSMNKGDIEANGSGASADTGSGTGSTKGRVQIIIPPSSSKSFPGARD